MQCILPMQCIWGLVKYMQKMMRKFNKTSVYEMSVRSIAPDNPCNHQQGINHIYRHYGQDLALSGEKLTYIRLISFINVVTPVIMINRCACSCLWKGLYQPCKLHVELFFSLQIGIPLFWTLKLDAMEILGKGCIGVFWSWSSLVDKIKQISSVSERSAIV